MEIKIKSGTTSHQLADLLTRFSDLPILVDGIGEPVHLAYLNIGEFPPGTPVLVLELRRGEG